MVEKKFDRDKFIEHFCIVNGCTKDRFKEHLKEVWDIWEQRSKHKWTQNLGEYSKFIKTN